MVKGMSPKKIIIDTDPGIDDAMAIYLALNSPELEVIALTTIFGNVQTTTATSNALHLLEFAGRSDIPVAHGMEETLLGEKKERYADFVHGADGLGNTYPSPPSSKPVSLRAPEFLVQKIKEFPGEIAIVALGPLTNIAKAIEADPTFAKNVAELFVLGGAYAVNGNVNPAAEANIMNDPEAADIVFISGANIVAVGINITHQTFFTCQQMEEVGRSKGKYGQYLFEVTKYYFQYHLDAYDIDGVYLHDPATMVAAIDPSLFAYETGVIRVQTEGICKGMTLFSCTSKVWNEPTEWSNKPMVKVAVSVDADQVSNLIKDRLSL